MTMDAAQVTTVLDPRGATLPPGVATTAPSGAVERVASGSRRRWRPELAVVLALSAVLNGAGLWALGDGNAYYAAAVQSMLTSWHNFFFVSFDSGGFVSIDKPPLGFWLQALSAKLLGFSGFSLLLPEALAGVVSVALLYHLVARAWGRTAGLAAASLLAITPVSVVAARANIVDGVLAMAMLLAALAVTRAVETGRLRWLLLGAVLVGLGFNVKMLEAYLVLPALGLTYLLTARTSWRRRLLHLTAAAAVLAAVSLSWVTAVDLTPASQRPYVGSSTGNSELNLALGYNGVGRVVGSPFGRPQDRAAAARPAAPRPATAARGGAQNLAFTRESGAPGPLRLFQTPLGSQAGWLLPLAVVGLVAAASRQRWRGPADRRRQSLVLWGTWLLAEGVFFSVASTVHAYYLTVLAPAVAALAGIGAVVLWRELRDRGRWGWLLPVALLGSAADAVWILAGFPGWSRWLTPLVLACAAVSTLLAVAMRWRRWTAGRAARWAAVLAAVAGAGAVLASPATWTLYSVASGTSAALPTAGPPARQAGAFFRLPARARTRSSGGFGPFGGADPSLLRYLEAHQGSDRYLVGSLAAMSVAPDMLASGRPALALGGFSGRDRIVDPQELAAMVRDGEVRFFLLPAAVPPGVARSRFGGFGGGGVNGDLVTWVRDNCTAVPRSTWSAGGSAASRGRASAQQLYDCSPAAPGGSRA
jgi:4-amino-4-deoxy-L-arabinose transferase-like glycosyltransferase